MSHSGILHQDYCIPGFFLELGFASGYLKILLRSQEKLLCAFAFSSLEEWVTCVFKESVSDELGWFSIIVAAHTEDHAGHNPPGISFHAK